MTNVNDFFCFIGLVFFKKEKKRVFFVYSCSSPQSYCYMIHDFDAQNQ